MVTATTFPRSERISTGSTRPSISWVNVRVGASRVRCPDAASHHHAPSALCPTPNTSVPTAVNERRRQSASAAVGLRMKVVSVWLNSPAIRRIASDDKWSASATTASGLPLSGSAVKTSTR